MCSLKDFGTFNHQTYIRKYLKPVLKPQIAKSIIDTIMTPVILYRILPPKMKNINPIMNPSTPIIEPNAIRNSIPSLT